jgi:hypothetical protein
MGVFIFYVSEKSFFTGINIEKMKRMQFIKAISLFSVIIIILAFSTASIKTKYYAYPGNPKAVLIATEKTYFNSFVDCNMAKIPCGEMPVI